MIMRPLNIKFSIDEEYLHHGIKQPTPAKKHIPEWFKKSSRYTNESCPHDIEPCYDEDNVGHNLTIKTCMPVQDAVTSGYLLYTTNDIIIINDKKEGKLNIQWPQTERNGVYIEQHSSQQFKHSEKLIDKSIAKSYMLKFMNPWIISTSPGTSCYFTTPAYHDVPFEILPGIVDTDSYPLNINFPFSIKIPEDRILIPKGTPFVHIYPFKRENWKMEVEKTDIKQTKQDFKNFKSVLSGWYRRFAHNKKRYD